ncbi:MAG: hypothetical protein FWH04_06755, partial [Oscillospiraceae bacterium]|nr:hypothetical protein [Oscillospiraceae bacterium]
EVPLSLHRQIAGAAFLSLSYAHYIDRRILCQPTVVTKLNRRGIVRRDKQEETSFNRDGNTRYTSYPCRIP